MKALDRKLATILAGGYTPDDFIIADAKDADMAFGWLRPAWRRARPRRVCAHARSTWKR